MDWMPQAIREGIFTILFISGPLVVLAAGLGLAIGIIQAATQVQEQTLGSAVKIIGLFLALIIFGFYMFQYMSKYAAQNLERAFKLVPTLGVKVLPRRNFLEIPRDEDSPTQMTTSLPQIQSHDKKGSGHADIGHDPDIEDINSGVKQDTIGQAASQSRPNPDIEAIKKQKLTLVKELAQAKKEASNIKPTIAAPAPVTAKPVVQKPQAQVYKPQPQPVVSTPVEKQEPKRLTRSSVSGRLSKLQGAGQ